MPNKFLRQSSNLQRVNRPIEYGSRKKRIKEEQIVHKIEFEMTAASHVRSFENSISVVYGAFGIGKSEFASELGFVLQEKYGLPDSGTYFLQCEPINHRWRIRKTMTDTWPTFREFIDKAESDKELNETVKMYVIDVIDALVLKGIDTICSDFGIVDMKEATLRIGTDSWYAVAWQELRAELKYQIERLNKLGSGVLILSHERGRPTTDGNLTFERPSMDLSTSVYNAIGGLCSMILRMRPASPKKPQKPGIKPGLLRCLSALGSDAEDTKDNLHAVLSKYPDGIIEFETARQAATKLLSCFEADGPERRPLSKLSDIKKRIALTKKH